MANITGQGRPTIYTKANKGDIYTDANTGIKYECLGPDGFVGAGDIEKNKYDWKEIKSAGGGFAADYGEEKVDVDGVTITWDGNIEGLTVWNHNFYKVSDITPSKEELQNGIHVVYKYPEMVMEGGLDGITDMGNLAYSVQSFDGTTVMIVCFRNEAHIGGSSQDSYIPEKGLYLRRGTYGAAVDYVQSLTINPSTKTVIHPVPAKYIEAFEETSGDTFSWDGNTTGLDDFIQLDEDTRYYRVSDVVLTKDDCPNGIITVLGIVGSTYEEPHTISADDMFVAPDGFGGAMEYIVVPTDNYVLPLDKEGTQTICVPKKGLYAMLYVDGGYGKSITVKGYTGFKQTKLRTPFMHGDVDVTKFYYSLEDGETYGYLYTGAERTVKATHEDVLSVIGKFIVYNNDDRSSLTPFITRDYIDYILVLALTDNGTVMLYTGEYVPE